jgi:hypothetical protein
MEDNLMRLKPKKVTPNSAKSQKSSNKKKIQMERSKTKSQHIVFEHAEMSMIKKNWNRKTRYFITLFNL